MRQTDQTRSATALWRSITTRVMGHPNRAVLILGANGDEGARNVTMLTAARAVSEGLRVCVVYPNSINDTTPKAAEGPAIEVGPYSFPIQRGVVPGVELLALTMEGNFMRDLITSASAEAKPDTIDLRRHLLDRLEEIYDFVLFTGGSIIDDPYSLLFAREVAGVFLVARSSGTRLPVLIRAKSMIEAHQGVVIGAVMTHRKYYVPGWLYDRL